MGHASGTGRFFGVYLLYCLNPRHRGRVYVGFTVNPARRVLQHNGGRKKGGAWRTSGRGPWYESRKVMCETIFLGEILTDARSLYIRYSRPKCDGTKTSFSEPASLMTSLTKQRGKEMVLVLHGFPSAVAALRFEWAWQHPHASRRLAHVERRLRSEAAFTFHLRVLAHMLRTTPWVRLPLTLRWLRPDFRRDLYPPPPPHMPMVFGPLPPRTLAPKRQAASMADSEPQLDRDAKATCTLCTCTLQDEDSPLCCPHSGCPLTAHVICLAEEFLQKEPGQLLPLEGQCPSCKKSLLWGDLIWLCHKSTEEEEEDLESEEEHWTDMLET
uniref:structure-specific endonuclease subunit SLX1 isoform X1 n=1 Tax=Jaculus jaculus TaxID=51337 RepID=UPI001E1B0DA4|nr:structure-specific endonuclease subunit SLX1 isoform X1 [Jaculus jaculus]